MLAFDSRKPRDGKVHMAAKLAAAGALVASVCIAAPPRSAAQTHRGTEAAIPATVALVETWPDGPDRLRVDDDPPRVHVDPEDFHARTVSSRLRAPVLLCTPCSSCGCSSAATSTSRCRCCSDRRSHRVCRSPASSSRRVPASWSRVDEIRRPAGHAVDGGRCADDTLPAAAISVSPQIEISNSELLSAPYRRLPDHAPRSGTKECVELYICSRIGARTRRLSGLKRSDAGRPMMLPGATARPPGT